MTDHAARAVELATQATTGINANHSTPGVSGRQTLAIAGVAEAILALADAVTLCDRTDFDTYRRSTWDEHVKRRREGATAEQMMSDWHALSDHARDGTPFGGPLCNCERVVMRARGLGWVPVEQEPRRYVLRPRHDDDLRNLHMTWPATPDHPEIVTERGQERLNGAGDVRGAGAER